MKKNDVLKILNSKKNDSNKKTKKIKKHDQLDNKKKEIIKEIIKETKDIKEDIKIQTEPKKEKDLKQKFISFIKKIMIIFVIIISLVLIFYKVTEYTPENVEEVQITGEGFYSLNIGDSFKIMTWNIGYGALGNNADYFRENGKMVQTADRNRLNYNLNGIRNKIEEEKPNILLLQEIDQNSKRVKHVDEVSSFKNYFNSYSVTFAPNYRVKYLAYPITDRVGHINSGIATYSKYTIESAKRIQLPSSNIWPASMVKEKKCLLVTYIPIKDSDKKLVIINVQLDKIKKEKNRSKQINKMKSIMTKEQKKGNYVIVAGDFKQTFSNIDTTNYPVQKDKWNPGTIKEKDFKDNWSLIMDNTSPTMRSLEKPYTEENKEKFQYYITDGYIVSNNLEIQEVKTLDYDFEYSYHNPVTMKITIKQ